MKSTKKKLSSLQRREERVGYLFLLPSFLGFVVFMLIPVIWGLILSLFEYNGFKDPSFIGLENFTKLFKDEYFYISLKNNLFYMVVSVFFTLLFGLLLAVFLNQPLKGRGFFKTVLFFPQLTSGIAFGMIFAILFTARGPINGFLRSFGMAAPPAG